MQQIIYILQRAKSPLRSLIPLGVISQPPPSVVLTHVFVSKVICPTCGKIFYGDNDTAVLGSLGGHMTASHGNGNSKAK